MENIKRKVEIYNYKESSLHKVHLEKGLCYDDVDFESNPTLLTDDNDIFYFINQFPHLINKHPEKYFEFDCKGKGYSPYTFTYFNEERIPEWRVKITICH